ncbi:MAG: thiamine pyrophosphate-dependent enzyme, partial [Phycisphaerales bacterium]
SDQDVRWCPGCGDYAVLTAMKKMAANLGVKREDFVFVSGIGCAARFPYYMNTYGAHTVHGRSPAFATGVKIANPDLQVFLISGARSIDVDVKGLTTLTDRGAKHTGTSFIEVYQDCNVFNHQTWFYATQKDTRAENTIVLENGKPLVFGAENDKGIRRCGDSVEVVTLGNGIAEDDLLIHDETNLAQAFLLSQLYYPDFPEPLGVFYVDETRPSYDSQLHAQVNSVVEKHGKVDLQKLVTGNNTWTVE